MKIKHSKSCPPPPHSQTIMGYSNHFKKPRNLHEKSLFKHFKKSLLIGIVIKVADIAEKFSLQLHLKINLELFLSEVVYQSLLSISFFL